MNIKIGGITYEIREIERLRAKDDRNLWGEIAYGECEIRLESDLAPQFKRVVLWHEIVHGILRMNGHTDHDEQLIDQLAYGIAQVLQDNPHLAGVQ